MYFIKRLERENEPTMGCLAAIICALRCWTCLVFFMFHYLSLPYDFYRMQNKRRQPGKNARKEAHLLAMFWNSPEPVISVLRGECQVPLASDVINFSEISANFSFTISTCSFSCCLIWHFYFHILLKFVAIFWNADKVKPLSTLHAVDERENGLTVTML